MKDGEYKYELRVIKDHDYNGFADVSIWYFSNGKSSNTFPGGHSDGERFSMGSTVVCRLKWDKEQKGFILQGFAEVTEFDEHGRPVSFGEHIDNRMQDCWKEPSQKDKIFDARESVHRRKEAR